MTHADRPLSPHLQIYRPQLTSFLSITHRISGILLTIGLALLTWGLCALAGGPDSYATFSAFAGSTIGTIVLLGGLLAMCWHFAMGIKHLILDTGRCFEKSNAQRLGQATMALAGVMTLIVAIGVFA